MSKEDTIQHILTVIQTSGGEIYGAEAVTQLEHALQTASLARDSGASAVLVAAALLHDIGHLLDDEVPGDAHTSNPEKLDDAHEVLRARSKRSGSATRARKTISVFGKASVPRSAEGLKRIKAGFERMAQEFAAVYIIPTGKSPAYIILSCLSDT